MNLKSLHPRYWFWLVFYFSQPSTFIGIDQKDMIKSSEQEMAAFLATG
jgi:hypothetical protein